jgi:putative sigma-54 modulation protein
VEIKVVAKHGTIPLDAQQLIEKKISKLLKFFERTTAIQVLADLQSPDSPHVEIKISAEHTGDFYASDAGPNVLSAVENVVEKIERQMLRRKEKMTDHHRGRAPSA